MSARLLGADRLLTLEEVADVLGCSATTVKRRVRAAALPAFRDGGLVRVRESDLRCYVLERTSALIADGPARGGRPVARGSRLWD